MTDPLPASPSRKPGLPVKMRRRAPEQALQRSIVGLLKMMLSDTAVIFHGANEGKRSAIAGKALKDIGLLPGLPDLGIVDCQRVYWMELKAGCKVPTAAQYACHAALQRAGSPVAIVRSIDDAMNAIQTWGLSVRGTWSIPGSVTVGGGAA